MPARDGAVPATAAALAANHAEFRALLDRGYQLLEAGRLAEAALHAELAAVCAAHRHCGLFVSPELERLLAQIGLALPPLRRARDEGRHGSPAEPRQVLHVMTYATAVGGMESMLRRWLRYDLGRSHSVALTRQLRYPVPPWLQAAVAAGTGRIHRLNAAPGGLLRWAAGLRSLAQGFDLVVLHLWNDDIVPAIAFADPQQSPPILLVDHNDHEFWPNAGIGTMLASLRGSGRRLALERRGIPEDRSCLLPTIVEPRRRRHARPAAKRALGIPDDAILLLSVARSAKFATFQGRTFLDAHMATLRAHPRAHLLIVGAGDRADWRAAIAAMGGRIRSLPEQRDVALPFEAADIYVDAYPFVSITSLLEAGLYGVPLVSRSVVSQASEIFWADAPGLEEVLLRASSVDEYGAILSRLIADPEGRAALGVATAARIARLHSPEAWRRQLDDVYRRCLATPRRPVPDGARDRIGLDEPDIWVPSIHGRDIQLRHEYLKRLRALPLPASAACLMELLRQGRVDWRGVATHAPLLVPEWLACRFFRRFPRAASIARWT